MTLSELIESLDDVATQLHEAVQASVLDHGQRQMLSEAEVRVTQTRRELTEFDLTHDYVGDMADIEAAEEEGWSH